MIGSIENPESKFGEGISHAPKNAKTRAYKLLVEGPNFPAMRIELRAETARHAVRYAKARWPHCNAKTIK